MSKVSISVSNDMCPQTMFLYGTYREDGKPNFGLFTWLSYCWDGEVGVMACIGGEKLTKDRIRATGVFSANLVNEAMLPLADYFGNREGYTADKMDIAVETVKGEVLNVPILAASPWSFELEVSQTLRLDDGDIFVCKVRNTMVDDVIADSSRSVDERMRIAAAVRSVATSYYSWDGRNIGNWGEAQKRLVI